MTHSIDRWLCRTLVIALALCAGPSGAEENEDSALGFERTPPRLSFADGDVSYWRPGDEEWTAARINTPLAAGDELSTGTGANLELQIGARAFLRAGEQTQLALDTIEPDYMKLELLGGTAALDLRELAPGQTLEIGTPNSAYTIEKAGYYRIEVADAETKFVTRRGGRAVVQTEKGLPAPVSPNEQLVVSGTDAPVVASYGAPGLDDWDRWNYSRSERGMAPVSARYVPANVYGADDLDDNGAWRTVPAYGSVWVPRVAVGWAPYSAGRWVSDPYYGWTWVDDAPWGWAPFHYGRWVYVGNYWAWAPGPRVVRAYYSPALVAFYSSPSFSLSVSFGQPYVGWVALGWGEPVVPWWGPRGCKGNAHWAGWGGPRVVNKVVIRNSNNVNVNLIHQYQNHGYQGAMVAVERGRFGHGDVNSARIARVDAAKLSPVRGGSLGVRANRGSQVRAERPGTPPAREIRERRVVTRKDPGRVSGAAETRSAFTPARTRNERSARSASAPPPTRVARAERTQPHTSMSKTPPARKERARERVAAPPSPAKTSGRNRERTRAPATASTPPRSRVAAPQRPRANATESRAASPARVDSRSRQRTAARAPRVEQSRVAREAPGRIERRPQAAEPVRESPRGGSHGTRPQKSSAPKGDPAATPSGNGDRQPGGGQRWRRG